MDRRSLDSVKQVFASELKNADSISIIRKSLLETSKKVGEYLTKTMPPLNEVSMHLIRVSTAIGEVSSKSMFKIELPKEKILEFSKRYAAAKDSYTLVALELGFPTVSDLMLFEVVKMVELFGDGRESEKAEARNFIANKYLEIYDDDKIKSIYEGWVTVTGLKRRMHILSEVIDAHLNGKFYLSIYGLLPHIEGVLDDLIKEGKRPVPKAESLKDNLDELDSLSLEYFLIVMMCEFAKYTDLPKSVNRHSILHGADLEFGTRLNSIIVILVFDFFVNQVYNTTVYSE